MKVTIIVPTAVLFVILAISGCNKKEDVASPNCVNPATKNNPTLCPRADTGIERSTPKKWSMGSGSK